MTMTSDDVGEDSSGANEERRKRRRWDSDPNTTPKLPDATIAAPPPPAVTAELAALAPTLNLLLPGGSAQPAVPRAETTVPVIDAAAHQAAQEAMRRMSDMLKVGTANVGQDKFGEVISLGAPLLQEEVDINDCGNKALLTKKSTQEEVKEATGASVLVRGRYKPPGDTSTTEKPLHLHVEAETQDALDRAVAMIRAQMSEGVQRPPPPPPSCGSGASGGAAAPSLRGQRERGPEFKATIEVGLDVHAGHQVRGKLLGPKGSYLKHIQEQTGTRVQLAGRGSGNLVNGTEPDFGLQMNLIAPSEDALGLAKDLAEHLVQAVRDDYTRRQGQQSQHQQRPDCGPSTPHAGGPGGSGPHGGGPGAHHYPPPYGMPPGYPPYGAHPHGGHAQGYGGHYGGGYGAPPGYQHGYGYPPQQQHYGYGGPGGYGHQGYGYPPSGYGGPPQGYPPRPEARSDAQFHHQQSRGAPPTGNEGAQPASAAGCGEAAPGAYVEGPPPHHAEQSQPPQQRSPQAQPPSPPPQPQPPQPPE